MKNRDRIRLYFKPPNLALPSVAICLGLALAFMASQIPATQIADKNNRDALVMVAGAIGVGGIIWLVIVLRILQSLPTDKQIDAWLNEDILRLASQSLDKLGLTNDEYIEAIHIIGPILWLTNGILNEDLLCKKGADNVVRFSVYRITIVQLADKVLGAYACDFNFIRDVALNEQTHEFHYVDVVSVSTQEISTSYTLPNGVKMVKAQAFRLAVSSGDAIVVAITADILAQFTGGVISTTMAEKAVQLMRPVLREKKSAR